jgi:hypothetical protein
MSPIIIKRVFSNPGKGEICGEQNLLREVLLQAPKATFCAAKNAVLPVLLAAKSAGAIVVGE